MRASQASRGLGPRTKARSSAKGFADRALVLRRFRYGESSLIVHVLTPEYGRLGILAKGAYRPKSGYCGVLDLFDSLDLSWSMPAHSDLGTLRAGSILVRRAGISRDLDRYRAGLSMLEIAGMGAREGHEEQDLFRLLQEGLDALERGQTNPGLACAAFDLRFLECQGLAPALEHCAACGKRPPPARKLERLPFSHAMGGRLCSECAHQAGAAAQIEALRPAILRVARSLQDTPFPQLARISLEPAQSDDLRGFLRRFLEYHLETRPRVSAPPSRRT